MHDPSDNQWPNLDKTPIFNNQLSSKSFEIPNQRATIREEFKKIF